MLLWQVPYCGGQVGAYEYMAPEVVHRGGHDNVLNQWVGLAMDPNPSRVGNGPEPGLVPVKPVPLGVGFGLTSKPKCSDLGLD